MKHEDIKEYYSKTLKTNDDLKTGACCPTDSMPKFIRKLANNIHSEVSEKFYGCGSPIPLAIKGLSVLDLGCGTGRDCYILSQLVGPDGKVIGVDMTQEQLDIAQKHLKYHMDKFSYTQNNIEFHKYFIENLKNVVNNSIDVVISNCVINLSPNKEKVFKEIFRVLKPGGELYFSDIFADKRIPDNLKEDKVLVGECLAGALYIEDFRRILQQTNCLDYCIMSKSNFPINDKNICKIVNGINFHSMTIRAFKGNFEDRCENYGHMACYLGTIEGNTDSFILDEHHLFKKGVEMPICGNTALMLTQTRFKSHFKVTGDFSTHYGLFECSPHLSYKKRIYSKCC